MFSFRRWLAHKPKHRGRLAFPIWCFQLALNFIWTPVFFAFHQIGLALVVILLLLLSIVASIVKSLTVDRTAPYLFVPYAAWVAFTSLLDFSIFVRN
jgi:tryptophan-rich sensory protein